MRINTDDISLDSMCFISETKYKMMMPFQVFCGILEKIFEIKKLLKKFNKYSSNFKYSD